MTISTGLDSDYSIRLDSRGTHSLHVHNSDSMMSSSWSSLMSVGVELAAAILELAGAFSPSTRGEGETRCLQPAPFGKAVTTFRSSHTVLLRAPISRMHCASGPRRRSGSSVLLQRAAQTRNRARAHTPLAGALSRVCLFMRASLIHRHCVNSAPSLFTCVARSQERGLLLTLDRTLFWMVGRSQEVVSQPPMSCRTLGGSGGSRPTLGASIQSIGTRSTCGIQVRSTASSNPAFSFGTASRETAQKRFISDAHKTKEVSMCLCLRERARDTLALSLLKPYGPCNTRTPAALALSH